MVPRTEPQSNGITFCDTARHVRLKEIEMKILLLAASFGWAAFAQTPLPPKTPNDQVVAKIDGKDVTAGDVYDALVAMPPEFVQLYNRNPKYAIQQLFMMKFLSSEADKYQLAERPPYKAQLEAQRANIMAGAVLSYMQDHFPVPDDAVKKYYDAHRDIYQQAKVKAISIRFKPVLPPNASVDDRMRAEVEAKLMNVQRSEEEARARAAEVVEKLKSGADFAKLVEEYSEDAASKTKGGDFGVVRIDSSHPDEIKKAVVKLKVGETSDPVRTANAFVIVRVDEKTMLSLEQVQGIIIEDLRKDQVKAWFNDVTRRFQPTVVNPEFFTQPAAVPSLAAPAPPAR